MKKKGDIWVSAVLYIALGMVVITLILSAGLPLISKMRDRNTIAQTKTVMFDIDNNIKAVVNEAKGSTRYLSPVDISAGQLYIDQGESNKVEWSMKTKNKMMEPDTLFNEGDLSLELKTTAIEDEYDMALSFDYNSKNIDIVVTPNANPFQGRFSFTIKNNGYKTTNCPQPGECLEVGITIQG